MEEIILGNALYKSNIIDRFINGMSVESIAFIMKIDKDEVLYVIRQEMKRMKGNK